MSLDGNPRYLYCYFVVDLSMITITFLFFGYLFFLSRKHYNVMLLLIMVVVKVSWGKILIYWMSKFVLQCVLVATGCSLFLNLNTLLLSNIFSGVCLRMEYSFSNLSITVTTVANIIVLWLPWLCQALSEKQVG